MDITWVVVADNARARFFDWQNGQRLVEFETMICPDQRLHEGELVSDRQGRIDTTASGRHGLGQADGIKDHERDVFAADIASRLEQGRVADQVRKLILVAPPQCLGRIRSRLSDPCAGMITHTVDKELTQLLPEALARYLPKHV